MFSSVGVSPCGDLASASFSSAGIARAEVAILYCASELKVSDIGNQIVGRSDCFEGSHVDTEFCDSNLESSRLDMDHVIVDVASQNVHDGIDLALQDVDVVVGDVLQCATIQTHHSGPQNK